MLGDVDDVAGVAAVEQPVPDDVTARPAVVVPPRAQDQRMADRDDRYGPNRNPIDPHIGPRRLPGRARERIYVSVDRRVLRRRGRHRRSQRHRGCEQADE